MEKRFFFIMKMTKEKKFIFRFFHLKILQDILIKLENIFIVDNHRMKMVCFILKIVILLFIRFDRFLFKQTTPPSDEHDESRYHLNDYLTIRTDLL